MFSIRTLFHLCLATIISVQTEAFTPHKSSSRIVGGRKINITGVPYIVQFRDGGGDFFCGGTLVSPTIVISAAHCFDDTDMDDVVVVGGATTLTEDGEEREIAKVTIHPEYIPDDYHTDLAIVELTTAMGGSNIAPVELCKQPLKAGDFLRVSGWGQISEQLEDMSNDLRSVRLPVATKESCKKEFGELSTKNMFCASGDKPKSFCMGDSGGPAIFKNQLCGIVSFLNDCGKIGSRSVFTDVYALRSYIQKIMKSN